jgi:hypothetical protein
MYRYIDRYQRSPETVLNDQLLVAIASSLLGGASVAFITQLSTRKRTQAEARKIDAETELTRAQTTKMLSEMQVQPQRTPGGSAPPSGWFLAGSDDYEVGTDAATAHSGTKSGFIASRGQPHGFGTLMQQFKAERFRANRLRMSAYVKTADVEQWAGLWMRVDGSNGETLAFDNMQGRPICGTTEWRLYRVVLDVPKASDAIAFGALLVGSGRLWLDDVQFEPVGDDVPTTGAEVQLQPSGPINLDFDL